MVSRWLSTEEENAWRSYRRMFTQLEGRLAHELTAKTGLSMADYTVLSNLVEAQDREARISELADQMQWSQSRLSHQLRRMEERGLIERRTASDDGRGAVAVLTKSGLMAIAQAAPVHFEGVRRHMIDLLSPDQVRALAEIAGLITSKLGERSPIETG